MKRLILLIVLIALAVGYYFYSTTSPSTYSGQKQSLTVAVSNLEATTLVRVAQQQGFFEKQGLDITFIQDDLGKFSLKRVLDGEADVATAAEFPVVNNSFKRDDIRVIGTIHASNKNVKYIVRKDSGITKVENTVGKTIATAKGTVGEFFLNLLLLSYSINPDDVNIIDMSPAEIQVAIEEGKIDGFALREPHVYKAAQNLGDNVLVFPSSPVDEVYTATFNLVTTQSKISQNKQALTRFLVAIKEAEEFTRQNPDLIKQQIAQDLQLNQEYLDESWDDSDFSLSLNQSLLVGMEDEARWFIDNGITEKTEIPDFLTVIDSSLLNQASPQSVKIIDPSTIN